MHAKRGAPPPRKRRFIDDDEDVELSEDEPVAREAPRAAAAEGLGARGQRTLDDSDDDF